MQQTASEKEEVEVISATAAFGGALEICMRRLKDETPAYQMRQKIAKRLDVDSERVELIKGERIVSDFDSDKVGPLNFVVKDLDDEDEPEIHCERNQRVIDRSKEQLRERESQMRISLLLNRPSTATLFAHPEV